MIFCIITSSSYITSLHLKARFLQGRPLRVHKPYCGTAICRAKAPAELECPIEICIMNAPEGPKYITHALI